MASINNNQTVNSVANSQQIETLPAKSSWISAFEYDQTNLRLTVHMKKGGIYQHLFFLPAAWEQLKTSQNHSKHYADNIKGKFSSIRVKNANTGKKPKEKK